MSNETGGLIGMNVIWSHFIVRYTTEDRFIIGVACDKKWGGSEARKPKSLKSGGLKPSNLIEVNAYESMLRIRLHFLPDMTKLELLTFAR